MKDINLLIVDDDKTYSQSLSYQLNKHNYNCFLAFNTDDAINYLNQINLDIAIISLDISSNDGENIVKLTQKLTDAKIIILSKKEDPKKRESYFQKGILDYHLTSAPLDHVADDIKQSLERLHTNKNETILLIDDSKLVRSVITNLLENRNYKVLCAKDATQGLQIIQTTEVSLVILDMELPDIHGIKVLEHLRKTEFLRKFPVLVLSGSENPSTVSQALKKGSSDFLRKPIQYEEFLLKMDLWIESSRYQRTIQHQKKEIETAYKIQNSLVNSIIEAVFIFENNICTQSNKEAVELMGLNSKQELLDKKITDIFTHTSKEHTDELLDDSSDHFFEDIIYDRNNKKRIVQIKEKNVNLVNKKLKIIAVIDITSIKQKEKMLNHQTKMASMGEMIGNIAHQWRQPLTAISVAAGGIKLNYELDMVDENEIIQELENIVNNTQFLSSTIEDFQNFLKDDRTMGHFSITDVIDKTLSIIRANLESHEIIVEKNIKENIQLNGLQNDLIQVLLNIVNNAGDILKTQENNKKKYIIIDVDKQIDEDIEKVIINVQDSGGGVPEDIIGKVFEPYFTTKHQSKGTGLGLYMTHQIITNTMLGEISVENKEFKRDNQNLKGANFKIKINKDLSKNKIL